MPTLVAVRYTSRLLAPLLLLVGTLGCGGGADAARRALPKTFPATKENWHGTIDHVEFVEKFSLDDYNGLVVLPMDTASTPMPPNDNTYEPVKQALARSTTVITQGIETKLKRMIPVSVASSGQNPAGKVLLIRGSITEMNPGSQAARYWVGFGAGSAGTRMSAEVLDGPTGRPLLRFHDGRAAPGGMFGGGYDELLNSNMTGLGQDAGVLLSAFSPPTAKGK